MKLRGPLSRLLILGAGTCVLSMTSPEANAQANSPVAPVAKEKAPEINFQVNHLKEENVEGPNVDRTYFQAGSKRIVFGQPKGTRFSAQDGGLVVLLNDASLDGEIRVGPSPFKSDFDLPKNALAYREAATKGLPREAQKVEVQQPQLNTYPYNGWKSLGFTWTYNFGNRAMVRTVSYINLEIGTQIVVTTLATKNDAEKVAEMARSFMSSWWVMAEK